MKVIFALVASLVVNFSALGALDWDVHLAQVAPPGTVLVTQLPQSGEQYADASTYHAAKSL
jgi:hypothetical protein